MEPNSRPATHPGTLPLTLPADVLRLPYPPATRLVLAEIVSLHMATRGCCDCSNAHFAARLTINKDTVNDAVKLLEKDGLISKITTRLSSGPYRKLSPNPTAIAAKAASNPYPEIPANPSRNFRLTRTEFPTSSSGAQDGNFDYPKTEIPSIPVGNSVYNITVNNTDNLPSNSPSSADAASEQVEIEISLSESSVRTLSTQSVAPPTDTLPAPPAEKARKQKDTPDPGPNFDDFWQAYDKKVDKHKCEQRWRKLNSGERAAALSAVPAYVVSTPDSKFRKNPLTWLNGCCWKDEQPQAQPSAPGKPGHFNPADLFRRAEPEPKPVTQPERNLEVLAQWAAEDEAELQARLARYAAPADAPPEEPPTEPETPDEPAPS